MKGFLRIFLCLILMFICISPLLIGANAEETTISTEEADIRELLQKSLTIQEIDRELERLTAKDAKLVQAMSDNETLINQQKDEMKGVKEKAGKILRSYYTGDRPSIIQVLLTADSLSDLFKTLEYMNMIITHDSRVLTSYKSSQEKLQTLQQELAKQRDELAYAKADYIAQKERILLLQAELDKLLAQSDNKDKLIEQINALKDQWRTKGLPLFNQYLTELSKSMSSFTDLLSKDNFKLTSLNSAEFIISDTQLNQFLRSKNKVFDNLNFTFEDDYFIAEGHEGDIQVSIKGTYTLLEDKIKFELLGLTFNQFDLPDTTIKDLNEQYSLGIDPSQVSSIFTADGVIVEQGKITIKLKMKF